jgi:hypothetical protein
MSTNEVVKNNRVDIVGQPNSDSKNSLCRQMGNSFSGVYPVLNPINPIIGVSLFGKYTLIEKVQYRSTVGGKECLGRCGADCTQAVSGFSSSSNQYTEDCMDHDMCASNYRLGLTHPSCNIIFLDAANDYFGSGCSHDLVVQDMVVSNSSSGYYRPYTFVESGKDVYLSAKVTNIGDTKLPNRFASYTISLDGSSITTKSLQSELDRGQYDLVSLKLASAGKLKPGNHTAEIYIGRSYGSIGFVEYDKSNNSTKVTFTVR